MRIETGRINIVAQPFVLPLGFTGRYCDSNINECQSHPCTNGGLCVDRRGGFECYCPNGTVMNGKND